MKPAVLALSVLLWAVACNKGDSEQGGTYTVRGVIKSMETAGPGDLTIHHEAVPDFVDARGEEVGMMSMTMPFGVQKGTSLEGIETGDKIEFVFETHWKARPTGQIKSIKKLPDDTELNLSGQ